MATRKACTSHWNTRSTLPSSISACRRCPGIDVIRELRDKGKTYPVLILTARDRWQDKVDGLSAGADDYVVKPFHFEEVSARVNALLRRSGGWASSTLSAGPVALDTSRQELKVNDAAIELTSFEYRIIEHLMIRAGEVISKTELTDRLYDQDFDVTVMSSKCSLAGSARKWIPITRCSLSRRCADAATALH